MGGAALLFNASHGIRFRAQPTSPLRPRTGLSSFCAYRRDGVQRCLAFRLEANKGAQSQRNSKSKLELSLKLISETSPDEGDSREELVSFLRKIEASIKRDSSDAERSIGGQKKQPWEPKSEDKKTSFERSIGGQKKQPLEPKSEDKKTSFERSIGGQKKQPLELKSEDKKTSFERSIGGQKKQPLEPKSEDKKTSFERSIGGQKKQPLELKSEDKKTSFERSIGGQKKQPLEPKSEDKKTSFEKSIGGQKKQPLEPKSEDKKTSFDHTEYTGPPPEILKKDDRYNAVAPAGFEKIFGILNDTTGGKKVIAIPHIKSSGPLSYSDKMKRDDSNNAVVPPHNDMKSSVSPSYSDKMISDNGNNAVTPLCNDIKSSGPPSNFDKLIRDNGDNAVALLHDYKPPRPPSRFVRRSPIPISSPAKQEESLKQILSIADNMRAIWEKPRDLKPELKLDRISMLKVKTKPKLRNKTKAGPKLEAIINSKLRDVPKAELELEPNSDLEAVTSKLRNIPEAESELESNSELEAVTMSELGDIPKAEPELKRNSELEAVTISQLRNIPKEPELEAMTVSELRNIAKARGLKGYTRIKKAQLVEILKGTSL